MNLIEKWFGKNLKNPEFKKEPKIIVLTPFQYNNDFLRKQFESMENVIVVKSKKLKKG